MSAPPEEDKCVTEFQADDPEIVAMQQRMAVLYLQQKEKGGIIDLEEEKNRFLVSSNRVSQYFFIVFTGGVLVYAIS